MTVQNTQCLFVYKKKADNTKVQNNKKQGSGKRKAIFSLQKIFPIGKSGRNDATVYS